MKISEANEDISWPSILPEGNADKLNLFLNIYAADLKTDALDERISKIGRAVFICTTVCAFETVFYAIETVKALVFHLQPGIGLQGPSLWLSTGFPACLAAASKTTICFLMTLVVPVTSVMISPKTPLTIYKSLLHTPTAVPSTSLEEIDQTLSLILAKYIGKGVYPTLMFSGLNEKNNELLAKEFIQEVQDLSSDTVSSYEYDLSSGSDEDAVKFLEELLKTKAKEELSCLTIKNINPRILDLDTSHPLVKQVEKLKTAGFWVLLTSNVTEKELAQIDEWIPTTVPYPIDSLNKVKSVSKRIREELSKLVSQFDSNELRKRLNVEKPFSFLISGLKPHLAKDLLQAFTMDLNNAFSGKKFGLVTLHPHSVQAYALPNFESLSAEMTPGLLPILHLAGLDKFENQNWLLALVRALKDKGWIVIGSVESEKEAATYVGSTLFERAVVERKPSDEELLEYLQSRLADLDNESIEEKIEISLDDVTKLTYLEIEEALTLAKNRVLDDPELKISTSLLKQCLATAGVNSRGYDNSLDEVTPFYEMAGLPKSVQDGFKRLFTFAMQPQLMKELDIAGLPSYMLFGPPGCGKTTIAKAVAAQLKADLPHHAVTFHPVRLSKFSSTYHHGTPTAIRDMKSNILAEIQQGILPVVFLDEIDMMVPNRDNPNIGFGENNELLEAFMSFIDELKEAGAVLFAATNRIGSIDSALVRPGRFDSKLEVPLPTHDQLLTILISFLKKIHPDKVDISDIAEELPSMKGLAVSDVKEAVIRAKFALADKQCEKISTQVLAEQLAQLKREKQSQLKKGKVG